MIHIISHTSQLRQNINTLGTYAHKISLGVMFAALGCTSMDILCVHYAYIRFLCFFPISSGISHTSASVQDLIWNSYIFSLFLFGLTRSYSR